MKHFNDFFKNPFNLVEKQEKDELKSIEEMLLDMKYKLESHEVETEDGYLLTLFRIKGKKFTHLTEDNNNNVNLNTKHPILFQHGLLDSSDGWLCNEEHLNLPLIMCNLGFDVWLSNSRGNKYSRKHIKYNPDTDYEFWAFSFEEMGYYDLPPIINHILLSNKNHNKLHYIGHSQGTCMLFAALSNDKLQDFFRNTIETFIALAPIARVGNMKSTLLNIVNKLKSHNLFSEEVFPAKTSKFSIWVNETFPKISNTLIDSISDDNSYHVNNQKRVKVYLAHYPSGTSLKSLNHFSQNVKSKKFTKYDYEKEANCHIYKSIVPTEYDLRTIKGFKIALICGENDKLSSLIDVEWLKEELEYNNNLVYYKTYKGMGHISFMVGLNIDWFTDLVEFLYQYNTKK